jgi:hypothetical protein
MELGGFLGGLAPGGDTTVRSAAVFAADLTVDVEVDAQEDQEPEEDGEEGAGHGPEPSERYVVAVPGDEHADGDIYEEKNPADAKHVR